MLVSLFRSNRPVVLLAVPVLVLLLWPGTALLAPAARSGAHGMVLYELLRPLLAPGSWSVMLFSLVAVSGLAIQLDHLGNVSGLFRKRNHLTALGFPLVMALLPMGLMADPALVGMTFVLWAVHRVWSTQGAQAALSAHFDAGLLIGLAVLVHPPYAFLLSVIWASSSVMRPLQWREYVLPVIGAALVLFLAYGAAQVLDPAAWDLAASFRPPVPAVRPASIHWVHGVLVAAFGSLLVLAGALSFANGYAQGVVREKNTRSAFIALACALAIVAVFDRYALGYVPPVLVAVPCAILLSWPLQDARRLFLVEGPVLVLLVLALWARWN